MAAATSARGGKPEKSPGLVDQKINQLPEELLDARAARRNRLLILLSFLFLLRQLLFLLILRRRHQGLFEDHLSSGLQLANLLGIHVNCAKRGDRRSEFTAVGAPRTSAETSAQAGPMTEGGLF